MFLTRAYDNVRLAAGLPSRSLGVVVVAAIVACEIGFWVVLAAGLLTRYVLRWPRVGAALIGCVPLVDLALLAFTAVDLRRGAEPEFAHGLAAVYLGFSVAFGHAMVRWADVRVAHRFASGPAPEPKPASGTPTRLRREWREFGSACLATAISTALLLGAAALAADQTDTSELVAWVGRLGLVLVVWLVGWPLWETVRVALVPSRGPLALGPLAAARTDSGPPASGSASGTGARGAFGCALGGCQREVTTISVRAVKPGGHALVLPAGALLAAQLVHAAVPGPDEVGSSPAGPVVGLVLLLLAAAATIGAARGMPWTRPLLRYTGWSVALGFLLYHAVPVTSVLTFPYWGRSDVGPVQWLPVLLAVAGGVWAIVATRPEGGRPPAQGRVPRPARSGGRGGWAVKGETTSHRRRR